MSRQTSSASQSNPVPSQAGSADPPKRTSKRSLAIIGVLVLLLAAGIAVYWLLPPLYSSFEVGMTKRQVLERFGEPLGRQTEVKDEGVFFNRTSSS